ncbi:hypothetical protein E2C06_01950 [Dankookia rubra]|uniref:Porin n=1 Tax=Dankookia rubra TaxID=1442381 RepID=A0A4V3AAN4_9PROT|nr:hypothetical protein [Dankookia rubra]TDH64135.1 hypothetical protein E2C06_01950 [Dankookia rubra]
MRACTMILGLGLLAGLLAGKALAQPAPPNTTVAPPPPPAANAPPPPGRGYCTPALPCRSVLNESFYYSPSGDRLYLTRR